MGSTSEVLDVQFRFVSNNACIIVEIDCQLLFRLSFAERFNKKCKNLTANKHRPFQSLANALVRDGTSRYFRWRRRSMTTRTSKVPITSVAGKCKIIDDVGDDIRDLMQSHFSCDCRVTHSMVCLYKYAKIGGNRFEAGEGLRVGTRCGSVFTSVRGGRSMYGLIKSFYRITCACHLVTDCACVTWFPKPCYPDGDPLTVKIVLRGLDVNHIPDKHIISLNDIQPSRICVEIDTVHDCMIMMRMEGIDTMPLDI